MQEQLVKNQFNERIFRVFFNDDEYADLTRAQFEPESGPIQGVVRRTLHAYGKRY